MGATLAHLCVIDCNLTRRERTFCHCSIDYAGTDPIEKSWRVFPRSEFKVIGWEPTDRVVRIVTVPSVFQPRGLWFTEVPPDPNTESSDIKIECLDNTFDTTDGSLRVEISQIEITTGESSEIFLWDKFRDVGLSPHPGPEPHPESQEPSETQPVSQEPSGAIAPVESEKVV